MTARDEAIKAIQSERFPWLGVDKERIARVLDAVPPQVLARFAVHEPISYVPSEGHVICLRRDVPKDWQYRYGSETRWYPESNPDTAVANPSVIVEARPLPIQDGGS